MRLSDKCADSSGVTFDKLVEYEVATFHSLYAVANGLALRVLGYSQRSVRIDGVDGTSGKFVIGSSIPSIAIVFC